MKWTPKTVAITAGIVVIGGWYLKTKAAKAAKAVGEAVDITSNTNLASRGAEAWWGGGDDGQGTIGTDFYDWNQEFNEKYYKYTPLGIADRIGKWWDG